MTGKEVCGICHAIRASDGRILFLKASRLEKLNHDWMLCRYGEDCKVAISNFATSHRICVSGTTEGSQICACISITTIQSENICGSTNILQLLRNSLDLNSYNLGSIVCPHRTAPPTFSKLFQSLFLRDPTFVPSYQLYVARF